MLGQWIGVSHRVWSALCYCILSDEVKVLLHTTVQNLTSYIPRDPNVQERIRDYHGYLEAALGSEDFSTILYGYDSFIEDDEGVNEKDDPNE